MNKKYLLFCIAILVYFVQLIMKRNHFYLPSAINNYLADLLCVPILLAITLFLLRKFKKLPNLQLSLPMIVFVCVYVSIVFEYILPLYSARYTSDILDVVAYFVGGATYYFLVHDSKRITPINLPQ